MSLSLSPPSFGARESAALSKLLSLTLALIFLSTQGACLSSTYELTPAAVEETLALPPEERGERLSVEQESRDSTARHRRREESDAVVGLRVGAQVAVVSSSGGSSGAGPRKARRRSPRDAAKGSQAASAALVITLLAVTFGVIAHYASSFVGEVDIDPEHPVHLIGEDGSYLVLPLAALEEEDLRPGDRLIISEEEGEGFYDRWPAPLSRRGLNFRSELGVEQSAEEGSAGWAGRFSFGAYLSERVGLFGFWQTVNSSSAERDRSRQELGLELQLILASLGDLSGGLYGWGGVIAEVIADDAQAQQGGGLSGGAGVLLEWAINTRLALTLRGGGSWSDDPQVSQSFPTTLGFAIY